MQISGYITLFISVSPVVCLANQAASKASCKPVWKVCVKQPRYQARNFDACYIYLILLNFLNLGCAISKLSSQACEQRVKLVSAKAANLGR
jgi:hypothetical protein